MFSSQTTNIAYTILIEISQYFNIFTNITAELFSDDFCKSKLNLLLYQIIFDLSSDILPCNSIKFKNTD